MFFSKLILQQLGAILYRWGAWLAGSPCSSVHSNPCSNMSGRGRRQGVEEAMGVGEKGRGMGVT